MSNLLPYTPLGIATLTGAPQTITALFPQAANITGNSLAAAIIQTHEANDATDLVFVGSAETDGTGDKALVLQGPLQSGAMSNENGLNVFDPDNITLMSNPDGAKVRVAIFAF